MEVGARPLRARRGKDVDCDAAPVILNADRDLLKQALLNVVMNAVEAMNTATIMAVFNVEALAKKVAVSRRQLFRKLKAVTGGTPNALIRAMRLKRAAQLLKESLPRRAFSLRQSSLWFCRLPNQPYVVDPKDQQSQFQVLTPWLPR